MANHEDGFLSPEIEGARAYICERYSSYRNLFLQVNRVAVGFQYSMSIGTKNGREIYAACLYARILATTQASVIVLERGLVPQSLTLLRSAVEALFALGALAKKPDILGRILGIFEDEQQRVARNALLWQQPELREIAQAEASVAELEVSAKKPDQGISAFDLAREAGLEDWYRSVYMFFSWSAHNTPHDLERYHLAVSTDRSIIELRNEPEVEGQERSWSSAIEVQLMSTGFLAEIFTGVDLSGLEPIREMLVKLTKQFIERLKKEEAAASEHNGHTDAAENTAHCSEARVSTLL
jgi:hypothetical protein